MPFFEYSSVILLQDCKRTQWTQLKFLRPDFGKSMMLFHKVSIFQCVEAKNSLKALFYDELSLTRQWRVSLRSVIKSERGLT